MRLAIVVALGVIFLIVFFVLKLSTRNTTDETEINFEFFKIIKFHMKHKTKK